MAEFDPIRAQRDVVNGAQEDYATVRNLARAADRKHAEAEIERNALMRAEASLKADLDAKRAVLHKLIWDAEQAARGTP